MGNGYIIYPEMIEVLGLKSNELLVFAIINQHSLGNQGCYHGSIDYLSKFTGASKNTVVAALKTLVEKNYITKNEVVIMGVKKVTYIVNNQFLNSNFFTIPEIGMPYQKLVQPSQKLVCESQNLVRDENKDEKEIVSPTPLSGNILDNINQDNNNLDINTGDITKKESPKERKDAEPESALFSDEEQGTIRITPPAKKTIGKPDCLEAVEIFHEVCTSFSRVTMLTDERSKKLLVRLKEMAKMDKGDWRGIWRKICEKSEASTRMKEGGWASFDWLIKNSSNYIKVLEGQYDKPFGAASNGKPNTNTAQRRADMPKLNVNAYWDSIDESEYNF